MFILCAALTWTGVGIALRLGFHAMLRPKEIVSLLRADVILPSDMMQSYGQHAIIRLASPKKRRFMGRDQLAVVDCLRLV